MEGGVRGFARAVKLFFKDTVLVCVLVIVFTCAFVLMVTFVRVHGRCLLSGRRTSRRGLDDVGVGPVSVVMPTCGRRTKVLSAIRSLLSLQFPRARIVVIGSNSASDARGGLVRRFGFLRMRGICERRLSAGPIGQVFRSTICRKM